MPSKPNSRKWTDIQTAIATVAVVTTLGLWNLFAQPEKKVTVQAEEPLITPPPADVPAAVQPFEPTTIPQPQAKIMFTQVAPQTLTNNLPSQPQNTNTNKKKKNNGSGTVTQTKTS